MSPIGDGRYESQRTGGVGLPLRAAMVVAAFVLVLAIAKPWALLASPSASPSPEPRQLVAAVSQPPEPPGPSAVASLEDSLCPSPEGWNVVVDDMEFGVPVRTWIAADVFAASAAAPPAQSQLSAVRVVSSGVQQLGFCAPGPSGGGGPIGWSGELWLESPSGSGPGAATASPGSAERRLIGNVQAGQHALSAIAQPVGLAGPDWPPGFYLLEAHVLPNVPTLWLGFSIVTPGGGPPGS